MLKKHSVYLIDSVGSFNQFGAVLCTVLLVPFLIGMIISQTTFKDDISLIIEISIPFMVLTGIFAFKMFNSLVYYNYTI